MRRPRSAGLVRLLAVALGSGLFLLGESSAQGARLLEIRVERDGQLVLKGMATDDAQMDPAIVWGYLKGAPLKPVGQVPPDPADPLRATLTGKIRVAILHGERAAGSQGDTRTDVVVTELHLVRQSPDSDSWQLAPGEVERTAQAGGVSLPQPQPRQWLPVAVGTAVAAVLLALVIWLAARRRRPGKTPPHAEAGVAPDPTT